MSAVREARPGNRNRFPPEPGDDPLPRGHTTDPGQAQVAPLGLAAQGGFLPGAGGEGDHLIVAARDQTLKRRLFIDTLVVPGLTGGGARRDLQVDLDARPAGLRQMAEVGDQPI